MRTRRIAVSPAVERFASIAFCGVLPALVLVSLFGSAIADDAVAFDFRVFTSAADAILDGASPYPTPDDVVGRSYVYPPLIALVVVPFTLLSQDAAGLVAMALGVVCALATLRVVGVRDWRCYGVLLLWPPVISAIQAGNVTLVIGLGAAVTWRFRDRAPAASAAALGITLAAKPLLWPLVVWLAATRRAWNAAVAVGVAAVLLVASWAVIGFEDLGSYPALLRRLEDTVGSNSYTAYIVGLDLGLPSALARALWLGIGAAALVGVVLLARRADERSAFVVGLTASLALTPIVWLHYFALLLVVVAVARPRLGLLWFVPLLMVVTPGSGHPTPFQTSWTLAVALLTVALAVRETRVDVQRAPRAALVAA
jgi:Glycosyltransferase family 87